MSPAHSQLLSQDMDSASDRENDGLHMSDVDQPLAYDDDVVDVPPAPSARLLFMLDITGSMQAA